MSDDDFYKENPEENEDYLIDRLDTGIKNDPIDFSFNLTEENNPELFESQISNFCENLSFDSFLFIMNAFQSNDMHRSVYDIIEKYSNNFIPKLLQIISNLNSLEKSYKDWFSDYQNEKSFFSFLKHFISISTQIFYVFFQNNGIAILIQEIGFKHNPEINSQIFEILSYVLEYSIINGIITPQEDNEDVSLPLDQSDNEFFRKLLIHISNLFIEEDFLTFDCKLQDIESIINQAPDISLLSDILTFFKSITDLYPTITVKRRILCISWDIMHKIMNLNSEPELSRSYLLKELLTYFKDLSQQDFPEFCDKFMELFTFVSKQWDILTPQICFVFIDFFFDIYNLQYEGFNMNFSHFLPFKQFNFVIEQRISYYEQKNDEEYNEKEASNICLKIIDLMTNLTQMLNKEPELFEKISSNNFIDNMLWICLHGTFQEKIHFLNFFEAFIKESPTSYIRDIFQHGRFSDPNFVEDFIQLKEDEEIQRQRIIYTLFSFLKQFATDDVKDVIFSQLGDDENIFEEEDS